jgi:hypothetical protein
MLTFAAKKLNEQIVACKDQALFFAGKIFAHGFCNALCSDRIFLGLARFATTVFSTETVALSSAMHDFCPQCGNGFQPIYRP